MSGSGRDRFASPLSNSREKHRCDSLRRCDKVHVHDLHATILHLLGFDHEKLTYRYAGRDFHLTDIHGQVVKEVVA